MPDLDALFRPRAIALVGVSPDKSIIRGRIVEAVTLHGFDGPLYAVSRSHHEIAGITCYPSVEALPGPVDLAIVTIPAEHVAATLRACGNFGVKAAVVISSGFGEERGEAGAARQRVIADIAREFDMAVLGPNAEGFLNSRMPLAATFSPAVVHVENGLRPEGSRGRGVAVVSQSGGIGFSFFHRGRPKALDFSFVVSTGNEAGLDAMDVAAWLVEDDDTSVVLAFLEGIRAPEKLLRTAARAAELRKPLVFAKIGRSEAGGRCRGIAYRVAGRDGSLVRRGVSPLRHPARRRSGAHGGRGRRVCVLRRSAAEGNAGGHPDSFRGCGCVARRCMRATRARGARARRADPRRHRSNASGVRGVSQSGRRDRAGHLHRRVCTPAGAGGGRARHRRGAGGGVALARPLHRARLRQPRPHRPMRGQAGDLLRLYARRSACGRTARPGRISVHHEHGERGEGGSRDEPLPRVPRTVRRGAAPWNRSCKRCPVLSAASAPES